LYVPGRARDGSASITASALRREGTSLTVSHDNRRKVVGTEIAASTVICVVLSIFKRVA